MEIILPPSPIARPVISILLAVKDGSSTLHKTIDSLLKQDFKDWELVAIDDGSQDGSLKVLLDFQIADQRRITIIHQGNQGLTKSLNTAISLARGEYFARLDADDLCLPWRLSRQLSICKKEELDFVVSRAFKNNTIVPNAFTFITMNSRCLMTGNFFVHGSFFGRAEVFKKLRYDENRKFAQDYDFILRTLMHGYSLGYIFEPLYVLGTGVNQISNANFQKQYETAKDIALKYHENAIARFFWNLSHSSKIRKMMKWFLVIVLMRERRIRKVF